MAPPTSSPDFSRMRTLALHEQLRSRPKCAHVLASLSGPTSWRLTRVPTSRKRMGRSRLDILSPSISTASWVWRAHASPLRPAIIGNHGGRGDLVARAAIEPQAVVRGAVPRCRGLAPDRAAHCFWRVRIATRAHRDVIVLLSTSLDAGSDDGKCRRNCNHPLPVISQPKRRADLGCSADRIRAFPNPCRPYAPANRTLERTRPRLGEPFGWPLVTAGHLKTPSPEDPIKGEAHAPEAHETKLWNIEFGRLGGAPSA